MSEVKEYPLEMVDIGPCVMLLGRIPNNPTVHRILSRFFSIDWCEEFYRLGFFSTREECKQAVEKAKQSGNAIVQRLVLKNK